MGYNTEFKGGLFFSKDTPIHAVHYLLNFLGEDIRDHSDWPNSSFNHINLELSEDLLYIQWNGSEKTYAMEDQVNYITKIVKEKYPTFSLEGGLFAQGETVGDIWNLIMKDGIAYKIKIDPSTITEAIICPECGCKFNKV